METPLLNELIEKFQANLEQDKPQSSPPQLWLKVPMDIIQQLDAEQAEWLLESLQSFVTHAAAKFVKGAKEHGGKITDRQALLEARNEILDLWFYLDAAGQQLESANQKVVDLLAECQCCTRK